MPQQFIAAIDQGTTSTRCILFDRTGPVAMAQKEHRQIFPRPGWVEHDPAEIWTRVQEVVRQVLAESKIESKDILAIGIANQRETTVVWNKRTGQPLCNAIVWQDMRTSELCAQLGADEGQDRFRTQTGLPLATYFSGPKLRWLIENTPAVRDAVRRGDCIFGTIDSWIIWNLTGGADGGQHVTDVTNASRTMLMNIHSLEWDEEILRDMQIPRAVLAKITASSDPNSWGSTRLDGPFGAAIPVCGNLGDQHAALVGQCCFRLGESKNTYGTGCFMLLNTGQVPVHSKHGLLTTVGYKFGDQPATYALEGSIAIAGALVQWVRDNLGMIASSSDIEALARTVDDNGGVYIVPAFSGLFAPHWRDDARGIIAGLTHHSNRAHIARAVLEAAAYQTRDVLEAMELDSEVKLKALKVDGGMSRNDLLMQFQADILGVPVIRCQTVETTAAGAAYAAGLAVGFWKNLDDLRANWRQDQSWNPSMDDSTRASLIKGWKKALERSMGWIG